MTAISPTAHSCLRWVNDGLNRVPDAGVLGEFLDPEVTLHLPLLRPVTSGIAGALAYFDEFHRTWGAAHTDVEELIDDGEKVAVRLRTRARHQGEFCRAPASNERVEYTQTLVAHADSSGRLVTIGLLTDDMSLAMDHGAVPPQSAHKPAKAFLWAIRTGMRRGIGRLRRQRLALEPPSGADAQCPDLLGPVEESEPLKLGRLAAERLVHAINDRDWDGGSEGLAPGCVFKAPPSIAPEPLVGAKAWVEFISGVCGGFPDVIFTIDDTVSNGDLVLVWLTLRGSHLANYRGLPPTGRPFTMCETLMFRIDDDGHICAAWQEIDALALLMQLGMYPARGLSPLGILAWFGGIGRNVARTSIRLAREK